LGLLGNHMSDFVVLVWTHLQICKDKM